ncbi:hypothetical protein [Tahibacter amnicola]|uniref:EF-hand domain-containing protein n=1 Tax=Tahibacter amnicola TaxID=2976241 RepID=A0ABY6BAP4_9GAMM|nr:hypothetical protein [Tahibacter amnicola]UXI66872.1 hypothetical protein N4264_19245 [Tahibacter amnicola]
MSLRTLRITAGLIVCLPVIATALPTVPPLDPPTGADTLATFAQLDRNQDGYVDKTELPQNHELHQRFAQLDKNSDGKLSNDEFARFRDEQPQLQ